MRLIIIIAVLICINFPLAFAKSDAGFDKFVKSREVVATLYFQLNNEDLNNSERKRLSGTINKLRELQKNGRMIRVEGFSSSEGDQENNFRLSFFRARSVADLIEAKGLPAEVTLTGYGDLLASSDDPNKERRVEIASYLKPVGMKKVKVADKKTAPGLEQGAAQVQQRDQVIDSYRVDQAIRRKIEDKNKGLAERNKALEGESFPGLSQAETETDHTDDLDRGYSLWRKSIDPDYSPKLSQSQKAADSDLQRGYSQSQKAADTDLKRGYSQLEKSLDPEMSPGVTQVVPANAPVIDALMIEQAIMDKIGAKPEVPSATVTQVDKVY